MSIVDCAGEGNTLQFTLNRPFAKGSQTKETGQWQWVGLPQANLINGKGFYGDCSLIGGLGNSAGVATKDPSCNVTTSLIAPGKPSTEFIACCMCLIPRQICKDAAA